MDPKRTREARQLAKAMDIAGIHPNLKLLIDWTQWAVGLFEECENCEGTGEGGFDRNGSHVEGRYVAEPCRSCDGRGFSLNQEQLERAAKPRYMARALPSTERWEDRLDIDRQMDIQDMEAAILAYLLEGK